MIAVFPLLYFAVLVVIGLARRKAAESEEAFFLAGRSGSALLLTGSLVATMFGSFGVMGVSGLAYKMGLVAGWYHWVGTIGLVVLGAWALGRVDMEGAFTLPEVLGRRFGRAVRIVSAALIAFAWISIIAAQLIAAGKILGFLGEHGGWWSATGARNFLTVCVGTVFVVYTAVGGQFSILRTDFFQAGAIIAALVMLVASALLANPAPLRGLDPEFLAFPFNDAMPFSRWLILLLTFGVPFLVGPDFYSRILSGRDAAAGRRAILSAAALMIPIVFLIVLGGVLGRALFGDGVADGETVLLQLGLATASPVWCGLLIAALLAAIMSSADTCLLTISTLVSRDLLDEIGLRPRSEARTILRARLIIVFVGALAVVLALATQDIARALYNCYKIYSPAVLVPFLGLLVFPARRFRHATGLAAIALGGSTAILSLMLPDVKSLAWLAFVLPTVPLAIDLFLGAPKTPDTPTVMP
ncbi:MAG: solute:Na+ symporter, family [Candidatus Sumerlaeota bacterium]|nr:solute:Na+ symporter, family [Candidatus Sumerlaeota bacterium]